MAQLLNSISNSQRVSLWKYVEQKVENFNARYDIALDAQGKNRTPLYHEDPQLWQEIVNAADEWCQSEFGAPSDEIQEVLHEMYD